MPTLTISTASLTGFGLDRAFALIAQSGLTGVEVSCVSENLDTFNAPYLQLLSKRHSVDIISLATPAITSPAKAEEVVELAVALGVKQVTISPPDFFDFRFKKWIDGQLRSLGAKKKIALSIKNPPAQTMLGVLPKYALNDTQQLKAFPDISLDTAATAGRSEPLIDIYAALKHNLVQVYLANTKTNSSHTLLTDGTLPLESLLTRLARDDYTGLLTLQIHPTHMGVGASEEEVLKNITQCKEFVDDFFKKEV